MAAGHAGRAGGGGAGQGSYPVEAADGEGQPVRRRDVELVHGKRSGHGSSLIDLPIPGDIPNFTYYRDPLYRPAVRRLPSSVAPIASTTMPAMPIASQIWSAVTRASKATMVVTAVPIASGARCCLTEPQMSTAIPPASTATMRSRSGTGTMITAMVGANAAISAGPYAAQLPSSARC